MAADWLNNETLVVVSVPDEAALASLAARAVEEGIIRVIWREPDIGNTITAVALQPSEEARRLCSQFPLALREPAMV